MIHDILLMFLLGAAHEAAARHRPYGALGCPTWVRGFIERVQPVMDTPRGWCLGPLPTRYDNLSSPWWKPR